MASSIPGAASEGRVGTIGLYPNQIDAVSKLSNGKVLYGDTGSGKSRAALGYWYKCCGGDVTGIDIPSIKYVIPLYIITTATKRDMFDWDTDMRPFMLSRIPGGLTKDVPVVVDSWQNIKKYVNVKNSFFIFDEMKIGGTGAWANTFIKIAKNNMWILLTATPGDQWEDYETLFIAEGFFKSRTEFRARHIVYNPYVPYKQRLRYIGEKKLQYLQGLCLVEMPLKRETVKHIEYIECDFNVDSYLRIVKDRWNEEEQRPIDTLPKALYLCRKLVNSDPSRIETVRNLVYAHKKCIIFYNYVFEWELLVSCLSGPHIIVRSRNGQVHEDLPSGDRWVYLVQYTSGCEGWNCITTDCLIFFSQTYSYKQFYQAQGRIDRITTSYRDLYYFVLTSKAPIDRAIKAAIDKKEEFNEHEWSVDNFGRFNEEWRR